jgi:hypothetical protein
MPVQRDIKKATGFLLLFLAAITPTLLVPIPAMEDYLDHLARMYVLTTARTSDANPYYQVSWALYPDLAMDLTVPQLARFMDVQTAGKLFFITAQLLIITGAIALEMSVKRHHEMSGFAALLTLYSAPFSFGFVNFEFGTGIALWGIALWLALSRRRNWWYRFFIHGIFSTVLFLAHFFALGIYGLVIGIFELRRVLQSRFNIRHTLTIVFILACPVTLMILLMLWTGASLGEETDTQWWFGWKPFWILLFLNGYSLPLALASAGVLTILLLYGTIKGSFSLSIDGKWIALGFLLVFIAMPFKLFGSRMADIRMITAAFLILPAFMLFAPMASGRDETAGSLSKDSKPSGIVRLVGSIAVIKAARSFGHLAAVVTVLLILVNMIYVGYVWASYQNDYRALKASFPLLRQNSFILVGRSQAHYPSLLVDAAMWRAPALAVYYAKAFVSSLYTLPGTHAVSIKPEWRHLAVNGKTETYEPPSLAELKATAEGGNTSGAPQYIRNWQSNFDYVYLLGPHIPNAFPKLLVELATDPRFTLYRVEKPVSPEPRQ